MANTDPIHLRVWQELLLKEPEINEDREIDHHFYNAKLSGRQNMIAQADLFPKRSIEETEAYSNMKEARFRELAVGSLMELKTRGLDRLRAWID